jgi:hypothetical protein
VPRIGREFMPPLNEGDLMFMPIGDPAVSLPQAIEIARKQNLAIQGIPEEAAVVAKIARADTSTDPAPLNMTEMVVELKPESEWRPRHDAGGDHRRAGCGHDHARRGEHLDAAHHQPDPMLTTGIPSEVGVKVSAPTSQCSRSGRGRWRTSCAGSRARPRGATTLPDPGALRPPVPGESAGAGQRAGERAERRPGAARAARQDPPSVRCTCRSARATVTASGTKFFTVSYEARLKRCHRHPQREPRRDLEVAGERPGLWRGAGDEEVKAQGSVGHR